MFYLNYVPENKTIYCIHDIFLSINYMQYNAKLKLSNKRFLKPFHIILTNKNLTKIPCNKQA